LEEMEMKVEGSWRLNKKKGQQGTWQSKN